MPIIIHGDTLFVCRIWWGDTLLENSRIVTVYEVEKRPALAGYILDMQKGVRILSLRWGIELKCWRDNNDISLSWKHSLQWVLNSVRLVCDGSVGKTSVKKEHCGDRVFVLVCLLVCHARSVYLIYQEVLSQMSQKLAQWWREVCMSWNHYSRIGMR